MGLLRRARLLQVVAMLAARALLHWVLSLWTKWPLTGLWSICQIGVVIGYGIRGSNFVVYLVLEVEGWVRPFCYGLGASGGHPPR